MYNHLCGFYGTGANKRLWKAKMPLKIKIFMWLVQQNAILTKDNLLKRKWQGEGKCAFCIENETVQHLFFECPMAKFVWSLVAMVVGAQYGPTTMEQFWLWVNRAMPGGNKFHMVGLAAIRWSI